MSEAVFVVTGDVSNTRTGALPPLAGLYKWLDSDVLMNILVKKSNNLICVCLHHYFNVPVCIYNANKKLLPLVSVL